MGEGEGAAARGGRVAQAPMRSPINWALLGLVIERPSYAYELAQRLERRYAGVLEPANTGHVYTALWALRERGLVEELPGSREARQPKPRYRATARGEEEYAQWLVAQAGQARRRGELLVLGLGALAGAPGELEQVIGECERAWLAEGMGTAIARNTALAGTADASALLRRLLEEERRLAVGAKLEWSEYARTQLKALGAAPTAGEHDATGADIEPGARGDPGR